MPAKHSPKLWLPNNNAHEYKKPGQTETWGTEQMKTWLGQLMSNAITANE